MKFEEKLECLKHIKLGVKEVFYYNYEGEPIPLRPISSFELDDCFYKALEYANARMADLVVNRRMQLIKGKENVKFENKDDYISFQKYYDTISYWIVYHSMKDFQKDEFKVPINENREIIPKGLSIIRDMKYVHDISEIILDSSHKPREIIKEILSDDKGMEIAYLVHYFNVPIARIGDITSLQKDYLIYSKGQMYSTIGMPDEDIKTKEYSISGEKTTLESFIKKLTGSDI